MSAPSEVCTTSKCSKNYLCRTEACDKKLRVHLLAKMEQYVSEFCISSQFFDYSSATEGQQSNLWPLHLSGLEENHDFGQVRSKIKKYIRRLKKG